MGIVFVSLTDHFVYSLPFQTKKYANEVARIYFSKSGPIRRKCPPDNFNKLRAKFCVYDMLGFFGNFTFNNTNTRVL